MKKTPKAFWITCCFLMFGFLFPMTAFADMGPKSAQTVIVENPPQEAYYLDLLTKFPGGYDNFGDSRSSLDAAMLEKLTAYEGEGWYPALSGGTSLPLFGSLTGEEDGGGAMVHKFSYHGVPNPFRVILVTQSGQVRVSEPMTREVLQSTVTYDYTSGEWKTPSVWTLYLRQFLSTFIPTLLIEGLFLLAFGFSLKENGKLFLLANLLTQLFVTATLGRQIIVSGPVFYFLTMVWVEAVVFATEALLYAFWLRGHSRGRRIAYALTANLGSMLAGIGAIHLAGSAFYSL